MSDSTCMRVHQHGAKGKGGLEIVAWDVPGAASRPNSKFHAPVDADGRPVGLRLPGGQVHDACEAEVLIEAIPDRATLLGEDEDEADQDFLYQLMCVDIDIGRASTDSNISDELVD